MGKEEMKNKISMALKDPVLQIGFEIICKENAELKEQIEKMKCCENCRRNIPFFFCEECTRFRGPLSPDAVDCWELKED